MERENGYTNKFERSRHLLIIIARNRTERAIKGITVGDCLIPQYLKVMITVLSSEELHRCLPKYINKFAY